jgi:hypothetical protein
MKHLQSIVILVTRCSGLHARPRDVQKTFDLLKKGANLAPKDAERLEERLKKEPDDQEARIELLSFYAARPSDLDLTTVKATLSRHILWLIENEPNEGRFWKMPVPGAGGSPLLR